MSLMMLPATEATSEPGVAVALGANGPSRVAPAVAEGSNVARFVVLLTPIFAVLSGLIASWVTKAIPGADLDRTQITTFMVAGATTALAASLQWLRGWQQHERLVALGESAPRVAVAIPASVPVAN